ncbi:Junctophilin-4 (Junctophilin-like 1 protein) (fragment) [Bradyrhizobium sp. ORS 278]
MRMPGRSPSRPIDGPQLCGLLWRAPVRPCKLGNLVLTAISPRPDLPGPRRLESVDPT